MKGRWFTQGAYVTIGCSSSPQMTIPPATRTYLLIGKKLYVGIILRNGGKGWGLEGTWGVGPARMEVAAQGPDGS